MTVQNALLRREEAIAKAGTLIEALPWLQQLRGRTVVVKYGGSAMADEALRAGFAAERVTMQSEEHRRRLATALAAFDSATVTTTHSFCDQVLRSLGVLADLDPGTQLVESLDELLVEAADDVYLSLVTELGELPFAELWSWRSPVPLPAGAGGERSDFARLACGVWYPLLDAEVRA